MNDLGRVAIYARYSTDRQSASSCEDQIAKLAALVRGRGAAIAPELVFRDEAVSGAVRDRPGLLALVRAVEAGRVDTVVVEDLGRLSRDVEDLAWVRKRLAYYRARLVAVDDGLDTRSEGAELMGDVLGGFKALYRREIAAKTLRGMEARARAGLATGAVPYGYATEACAEGQRIVVEPEGARVVRDIFEAYAGGRSLARIASGLNERGLPPPRASRPRKHEAWGVSTIRAILHNASYVGRWAFGRKQWKRDPDTRARVPRDRDAPLVVAEHPHLAIVDMATWERVRARFERCRKVYTGRRTIPAGQRFRHPLSGVLRCGHCGAPLTVQAGGRYYRCSGVRRGTCDLSVSIRESVIRESVIGAVRARFGSPSMRRLITELTAELLASDDQRERSRRDLAARVEKAEARSRRLVLALADGRAPDGVVAMISDLESEARSGRAALTALANAPRREVDMPSVDDVLDTLAAELDGPPDAVRGALRRMLDGGAVLVSRDAEGALWARGGLLPAMSLGRDVSWIAGAHKAREVVPFRVLLVAAA